MAVLMHPWYYEGVAAIDPSELSDQVHWYKGDSLGTAGTDITTWSCSYGNAALVLNSGSQHPTVATVGGFKAAEFDRSNADYMYGTTAAGYSTLEYWAAVQKVGTDGGTMTAWNSTNDFALTWTTESNPQIQYKHTTSGGSDPVTFASPTLGDVLIVHFFSAPTGSGLVSVNNGTRTTWTNDSTRTTSWQLFGGAFGASSSWSGRVLEAISVSAEQTESTRSGVYAYLSGKYSSIL